MRVFVLIFVMALTLTTISTPFVRRLAIALGFVDRPSGRKLHRQPMPLLGGVAIVAGALAAFVLLLSFLPVRVSAPQVLGTLAACAVVALTGLLDDSRQLPAWAKLGGQVAGFLILASVGVRIQLPIPEWLNYAVTLIWLVGISNAINFLDNMDGLSAGVSAVAASFFLLLAAWNEQYLVASLSAGVLGATLGFLRYNFRPAQIFMGDAGALFLGFVLAVLGIQLRFPSDVRFVVWMVPILILGLPILDTSLVIVSRLRRRVNPFTTAGKDHLSHRLVERGFSQREAVLVLYLIAGGFGMIGLFVTGSDVLEGYAIGLVTGILVLVTIWRLDWHRPPAAATQDGAKPAVESGYREQQGPTASI